MAALKQAAARAKIASTDASKLGPKTLVDSFNRRHDYLRISLTEKCNLRCTYCMPADGVPLQPKDHMLTMDEIVRLASLFVQNGITKIRLTGGEPTLRKDLLSPQDNGLSRLSSLAGLEAIGMTSNGIALHRRLPHFVSAGLTHLNLSLDTLDEFKFELMTRRRGHSSVLSALEQATNLLPPPNQSPIRGKHLSSVKLNVVVIKGVNDKETIDFLHMAKEKPVSVRFIEYMPFDDNKWASSKLIPSSELLSNFKKEYPNLAKLPGSISDTSISYSAPGWKGSVGFISSMTDHFCAGCSRLRLNADGGLKVCLFGPPKLQLRPMIRSGATDQELLESIRGALYQKHFAHDGKSGPSEIAKSKNAPMVLIGVFCNSSPLSPMSLSPHNKKNKKLGQSVPFHIIPNFQHHPSLIHHQTRLYSSKVFKPSNSPDQKFSHLDEKTGEASMVNVGDKTESKRTASACGRLCLTQQIVDLLSSSSSSSSHDIHQRPISDKKGDIFGVARIAGIMASKRTSELIPLCHGLPLSHVEVNFELDTKNLCIHVTSKAECHGKTGVEMEALTAVSVACMTLWDMIKSVGGKDMVMEGIMVTSKTGGKSGDWSRK